MESQMRATQMRGSSHEHEQRTYAPWESSHNQPAQIQREIGGRDGLDPTRYGDWEVNGRCTDF